MTSRERSRGRKWLGHKILRRRGTAFRVRPDSRAPDAQTKESPMQSGRWPGLLAGIICLTLGGLQSGCSLGTSLPSAADARQTRSDVARGNCEGITPQGCCSGTILIWCDQGELKEANCAGMVSCGWNPMTAGYDCGTDGTSDPQGQHPLKCGTSRIEDSMAGDSLLLDVLAGEGDCHSDFLCRESDGSSLTDVSPEIADSVGAEQTSQEEVAADQRCTPSCLSPLGVVLECGTDGCGGSCGAACSPLCGCRDRFERGTRTTTCSHPRSCLPCTTQYG